MERLVKTPWFDYEIPFTQAAELGTRKVITDHSTIGLVITADGSFGEIKRPSYMAVSYTHLDVYKRQARTSARSQQLQNADLCYCACLLYTSRCV